MAALEPSDSALYALLCLSPPSPTLTSSGMAISMTSGTIPIFLDGSTEVARDEHGEISEAISYDSLCEARSSFHLSPGNIVDAPTCLPTYGNGSSLPSSTSQRSCGTFGPLSARESCWSPYTFPDLGPSISSSSPLPINRTSSTELPLSSPPLEHSYSPLDALTHTQTRLNVQAIHVARAGVLPGANDFHCDETLVGPPAIDAVPSECFAPLRRAKQDDQFSVPGRPMGNIQSSPVVSPVHLSYGPDSHHATTMDADPSVMVTPRTPEIAATRPGTTTEISSNNRICPENLPWLKDIVVELLVDQEGFRSVQPAFKLSGYSNHAGSLHPEGQDCDGGVAEFMPVQRQAFNFHYAPFDSPPLMRRITVNKQEERDYITRQAVLNVKVNGVYTVRGVETNTFSVAYASEGSEQLYAHVDCKMRWKFEYLVGDRKLEKTGRFLDGEKTLTPLTFSCSPMLLHPSQGRKVKLMHLVRKTVAPKLVAEKLELPLRMRGPTYGGAARPPQHPALEPLQWNIHRRTQSQAHSGDMGVAITMHGSLDQAPNAIVHHADRVRNRRRASSAGSSNLPSRNHITEMITPASVNCPCGPKHIVPRSQLSEIFDSYCNVPSGPTPLSPYRHPATS